MAAPLTLGSDLGWALFSCKHFLQHFQSTVQESVKTLRDFQQELGDVTQPDHPLRDLSKSTLESLQNRVAKAKTGGAQLTTYDNCTSETDPAGPLCQASIVKTGPNEDVQDSADKSDSYSESDSVSDSEDTPQSVSNALWGLRTLVGQRHEWVQKNWQHYVDTALEQLSNNSKQELSSNQRFVEEDDAPHDSPLTVGHRITYIDAPRIKGILHRERESRETTEARMEFDGGATVDSILNTLVGAGETLEKCVGSGDVLQAQDPIKWLDEISKARSHYVDSLGGAFQCFKKMEKLALELEQDPVDAEKA